MVISSYAVGMRGILLKVAIVQVSFTLFFQLASVHGGVSKLREIRIRKIMPDLGSFQRRQLYLKE
jgi:hypothetical protein